jgi:mannose-6-phosphate isomerase-like protein (cupin superfamily)
MIQGKTWGTTEGLLVTPMIELHRIHVQPNMKCSEHKHEFKWNAFYCVKGSIQIHVRKNDYDLTDVTELKAGEFTTVAPNEFHWFETTNESTEVLEIYYVEPISSDIVRRTVGGPSVNKQPLMEA